MKKIFAMILLIAVLFTGTAFAGNDFSEHLTISLTSLNLNAGTDYTSDEMYKYFSEKFNIDMDPWVVENSAIDEKGRIFVNSETMPDMMLVTSLDYVTFCEWVDQGLIAALPDGWKEDYPNIARVVEKSMIEDYITFDGKCYLVPHALWNYFIDTEVPVEHHSITYRKDWAEQLGITIGETITFSEFADFNRKAIEAGLGGEDTIGIVGQTVNHIIKGFMKTTGYDYEAFSVQNGEYIWNPTLDAVKDGVKLLRDWYSEGLIHSDFYLMEGTDCQALFSAGKAASMMQDGGANNLNSTPGGFANANGITREEAESKIGITLLTTDEGELWSQETGNYWQHTVFPARLEEDTVRFERVLSLMDHLCDCTPDGGYLVISLGMKDVDWSVDENGEFVILTNYNLYDVYPSRNVFRWHGPCGDEANLMNPNTRAFGTEGATRNYGLKGAGNVVATDKAQQFYVCEAKANYSVDVQSEIIALMVDDSLDIDTEWDKFVEENKGLWQPVVDELNANVLNK